MKNPIYKILSVFIILFMLSCTTTKSKNDTTINEVWEEGISTLTGTITKVTPEKDGQSLVLTIPNQIEYNLIVSIPNLGENAVHYRTFRIGEYLTFKGNLGKDNTMIVREILETM